MSTWTTGQSPIDERIVNAVRMGLPITILGRRYICDDPEPEVTFIEAEAKAMRKALQKLDRKNGR